MEVILGGVTSLLYGVGDFLGGQGARRSTAPSVVLWAGVVSFPLMVAAAVIVGGDAAASDMALGAIAGASGAFGLVALFAGLARGQAALVAPVAATLAAVVPVLVAVLDGERPSALAWAGVVVAMPAIALCAWVGDAGAVRAGGLLSALVAGAGFGGFTVVIDLTSPASNLMPLITARGSTMAIMLLVAATGTWRISPFGRVPRAIVASSGICDAAANVTLLLALRAGSLALAAVAASFYPAMTVLLARLVNGEQLRRRQMAGLVMAVAALAAIATG